ncbi:MAG: hypothetical protein QNJ47_22570 [Nostocaceae cyanobacterium]|nr:hypothetical protein [Nostocaceae cyanobacterium]
MTKTISSRQKLSPQKKRVNSHLIFAQNHSDEAPINESAVNQRAEKPLIDKLQVVHATKGRIRICATDGNNKELISEIAKNICEYLRQQAGVNQVTVNRQTGSLTVRFDEDKLTLPQMLARLEEFGIAQHQDSLDGVGNSDPFAPWKSWNFWREQGVSLIPLFTGLGVTSALKISGWTSIAVYMITADATRWMISYIQPLVSDLQANQTNQNSVSVTNPNKNPQKTKTKNQSSSVLAKVNKTLTQDISTNAVNASAKIAYSIAHQIPGRIRFHIPLLGQDKAYGRRLEKLLKNDPQVTNVRLNPDAASLAISYKSAKSAELSISHWVELMQSAGEKISPTHPIKTTESVLTEPIKQPSTIPEKTTLELSSVWADLKIPALSTALTFMANFPLEKL